MNRRVSGRPIRNPRRAGILAGLLLMLAASSAAALDVAKVEGAVVLDPKAAARQIWKEVKPEYPALARVNYIQGHVQVRIVVSKDGRVSQAHVVQGHPFLAVSVLQAVRRWLYHPLRTADGPVEFTTLIDVNFTLHTRKVDSVPLQPVKDLDRQVHPPQVLNGPPADSSNSLVRMRVLVGDKGEVLDSTPLNGLAADFPAARKIVEHWTYRPARWGAMAVPWYLDVDVPVENSVADRGSASSPAL
ncbi:MAG TPA: energy transducer TonB [Terriglobia bacterium]|nr:energy transducer TonB [Terriglobia bacterium]